MNLPTLCFNDRKEPFNSAYVSAIATAAGYGFTDNTSARNPDRTSIDLIIHNQSNKSFFQDLKIQAKCTDDSSKIKKDHVAFHLKEKNYSDIKNNRNPHILVVLVTPKNIDEWIVTKETHSELRYCCYWYSLHGLPDITSQGKTLHIPRTNILDIHSLSKIMNLLHEGKFISHDNTIVSL